MYEYVNVNSFGIEYKFYEYRILIYSNCQVMQF